MADLTKLTDEELEQHGFKLGEERAAMEAEFREQQLAQQAEVTRRSDEARLARMADTLSADDREALVQYLDTHPVEEAPAEEAEETEAEPEPAAVEEE